VAAAAPKQSQSWLSLDSGFGLGGSDDLDLDAIEREAAQQAAAQREQKLKESAAHLDDFLEHIKKQKFYKDQVSVILLSLCLADGLHRACRSSTFTRCHAARPSWFPSWSAASRSLRAPVPARARGLALLRAWVCRRGSSPCRCRHALCAHFACKVRPLEILRLPCRLMTTSLCAGISELFSHQATAIRHLLNGYNVVVATATSSGKSLAFNVPVFGQFLGPSSCPTLPCGAERLVMDKRSRALYVFPTKALAQDQLRALTKFVNDFGTLRCYACSLFR
jgi:ATP-dependent helicase YprA (DUF1998 family)